MILFKVSSEDGINHVIATANDREEAKRKARKQLLADPDRYIVTPLTKEGDKVIIKVNNGVQFLS